MEFGEAQAFTERLRPNIEALAAMPDEALRQQATDSLLHSPEAEAARHVLLATLGQKIGELTTQHTQKELDWFKVEEVKLDREERQEALQKFIAADDACESVVAPEDYQLFKPKLGEYVDDLLVLAKAAIAETKQQTQGLRPKKAARFLEREKVKIQALAMKMPDGYDGDHIARSPHIFSMVQAELLKRSKDESLGQLDCKTYERLGLEMIHLGEKYAGVHADELQQDKQFMGNLLKTVGLELQANKNVMGWAAHLLRGYYRSAKTPEQAIGRHIGIIEGMLEAYEDPDAVATGVQILIGSPAWFSQIEFMENFMAAYYGTPNRESNEQTFRHALHLQSFLGDLLATNLRDIVKLTAQEALPERWVQLQRERKGQASQKLIEVYGNDFRQVKESRLSENLREQEFIALAFSTSGSLEKYLYERMSGKITGPDIPSNLRVVYLEPYELAQRFQETFGRADFNLDMTSVQVVDGKYVLEVKHDVTMFAMVLNAQDTTKWLDQLKTAIVAFKQDRYNWLRKFHDLNQVEEFIHNYANFSLPLEIPSLPEGAQAYLRRRTKFDDAQTFVLDDFNINGFHSTTELISGTESLERIRQFRTRFVPKRGVQVVINDSTVKESGLTRLIMRSGTKDRIIFEATVHGQDRIFQLKGNGLYTKRGNKLGAVGLNEGPAGKFIDYCVHALAEWMCRPKVDTSEGTIEEGKEGPIKGGYFAYLPVRESDGRKYQRSDEQWNICVEEKGLDLDEESKRLALLDKSGKMRNSTYVREHPDDGPHLAPLKVYL